MPNSSGDPVEKTTTQLQKLRKAANGECFFQSGFFHVPDPNGKAAPVAQLLIHGKKPRLRRDQCGKGHPTFFHNALRPLIQAGHQSPPTEFRKSRYCVNISAFFPIFSNPHQGHHGHRTVIFPPDQGILWDKTTVIIEIDIRLWATEAGKPQHFQIVPILRLCKVKHEVPSLNRSLSHNPAAAVPENRRASLFSALRPPRRPPGSHRRNPPWRAARTAG